MEKEIITLMHCAKYDLIDDDDMDFAMECYLLSNKKKKRLRSNKGLFNLTSMEDDEVVLNFRFERDDIYRLKVALGIPDVIEVLNCKVNGLTALCILLRRLTYPNRLSDLENMFGYSNTLLSTVANWVTFFIENKFRHLLNDLSTLMWIDQEKLNEYSLVSFYFYLYYLSLIYVIMYYFLRLLLQKELLWRIVGLL